MLEIEGKNKMATQAELDKRVQERRAENKKRAEERKKAKKLKNQIIAKA